ncbi:uncharacterized protein [Amphiura filiformis]|uniref:uncharacterized protein n=1 Tax=Amphiura filiformis TaxID=82378 RepID=UPI003B222EF2
MCDLSISPRVGERWYLCVIFAATLATCSLSVLPDVRASTTDFSLADELAHCCVFDPPAITNCSWKTANNTVRHCNIIAKYNDDGNLMGCGLGDYRPAKNIQYPAPPVNLDAKPFTIKCLPKNLTDTCSKYHNQYFNGLNITVALSAYIVIPPSQLVDIPLLLVGINQSTGWNQPVVKPPIIDQSNPTGWRRAESTTTSISTFRESHLPIMHFMCRRGEERRDERRRDEKRGDELRRDEERRNERRNKRRKDEEMRKRGDEMS